MSCLATFGVELQPGGAIDRRRPLGRCALERRPSPILQAMVHSNPHGIHCSSTRRRIGTRMPSSASGLTGVRSAWPKPGTGTRAICMSRTSGQYKYQLEHYGPPSRFGYKDLCAQWTLLNWDPDELITRYKNAGAKIFVALANHHDSFDAWDSKHQPWNAAAIGPHRDVIGTWAAAARKQGLRFGVTVHQARNWWWFQPSHGADKSGPNAGVPYDGRLTQADGQRSVVAGARSSATLWREAPG